jgi:hypothetical protein
MSLRLISTVTVGSGGATAISFSSIPASFTDLCVMFSTRVNASTVEAVAYIFFNANGDNYSARRLKGDGSGVSSGTGTSEFIVATGANTTANTFSNGQIYIPNYSGSTNKSYSVDQVIENNATSSSQAIVAGLWGNTAAINSIDIVLGSNNFVQHSTASLYGITRGSGGATVS